MKFRTRTRIVYATTVAAALAMVAGFALASFSVVGFVTTFPQGGASAIPTVPAGVSPTSVVAIVATGGSVPSAGSCTATDASTAGAPDALVQAGNTIVCLNSIPITGYLGGDNVETITFTWSCTAFVASCTAGAPASTIYELSIFIGGATPGGAKAFVRSPAWTAAASAQGVIAFDLTTAGVTSVSSVNVIVSQCSGATCP